MKKSLFILLLISHIPLLANMANPVFSGTSGSRPFTSEYAEVLHEDLRIQIDQDFETARFDVSYHIHVSKDSQQIPLLFYAADYEGEFQVTVDGEVVETKDIPYQIQVPEGTKFADFDYLFKPAYEGTDRLTVLIEETASNGFYAELSDMIYFEADMSEGEHHIEVSYLATQWVDSWDWVKEYSFRYALSPAKYWKPFGTLSLTLDARQYDKALRTNLRAPDQGVLDSIAIWQFDSLPVNILQVIYEPEISETAQMLLDIDPDRLAYATGLLLMLIHIWLIYAYRKRNPTARYSPPLIVGSLLIPLIFMLSWIKYYDLIEYCIGEHSSSRYGYQWFFLLLYPLTLFVYGVLMWIADLTIKNRLTR